MFSVRNQTLARCSAEMFPVYTITNCETVCSCNRLTGNPVYSTSTSTSTLFHKTIGYNRLARKIAIANLGGPVKRKIN